MQLFDTVIARDVWKRPYARIVIGVWNCGLHFDLNKLIRYWKVKGRLRQIKRALVVVHQSLCKWDRKNICVDWYISQSRVKQMNYCSSVRGTEEMIHLLCDRKFGNWSYQNTFTGNIRWCSKHRMWQKYENIGVYDRHFNECRLLFFVTC